MLYYALGPNCYGIGKTREEAIKLAAENWPNHMHGKTPRKPKPHHFSVWETTADKIVVSEIDGSFSVSNPHRITKLQTSTLAVI